MNLRGGIGSLNCRLCAASFQMPIHHLHEPIDVFSEWLDACETAERTQQGGGTDYGGPNRGLGGDVRGKGGGGLYDDDDDEDDDDDDILGEDSGFTKKPKAATSTKNTQEDRAPAKVTNKPSEKNRSRPSYATLGLEDSEDEDEE